MTRIGLAVAVTNAPRKARAAPTPAAARATAATATRNRLRLIRRLASPISGSSDRGKRGACAVIALLSVAPPPSSSRRAQVTFPNTGPADSHLTGERSGRVAAPPPLEGFTDQEVETSDDE